jgi:predicted GNAT family N-acyltransferase
MKHRAAKISDRQIGLLRVPDTGLRVRKVSSGKELEQAFNIRLRVFVSEQGVPADIELDHDDRRAIHFLAYLGDRPVGTARLVVQRGMAKVGRMAVLKTYRGRGIGSTLLQRAVSAAKRRRIKRIYLHAQLTAIGFYEPFGFRCTGRNFDEAGLPHRKMILSQKVRRLGSDRRNVKP